MDLRYAPEMLEEAVARESLRRDAAGDGAWIHDFHLVTDPFYGLPEIDGPCEYFSDAADFELHFDNAEKFDAWAKIGQNHRNTTSPLPERPRMISRHRFTCTCPDHVTFIL